ncbi:hypothetical protein PLEOSDRAFT_161094 [Pleurotus ostreatus PC15]|uniref:Uncharacterized protein n=1 Tax=Pleurotus ostreatus (strain PC15) TaxID=1137138 RepID=A0A067NLA3_PLEO1|nr:hypothetical protein PLEOSDRAFT_161094 [Pleurotus ostreatus PC15]
MSKRYQPTSELACLQASTSLESSLSCAFEPNSHKAATTVNITNFNFTYGGDSYSGNINDGFAGGRHNRNSSTSYDPTSVFSVNGVTLTVGMYLCFMIDLRDDLVIVVREKPDIREVVTHFKLVRPP